MTTRTRARPEWPPLKASAGIAIVWGVLGLAASSGLAWLVWDRTILIIPLIIVVAAAVITVKALSVGGGRGR